MLFTPLTLRAPIFFDVFAAASLSLSLYYFATIRHVTMLFRLFLRRRFAAATLLRR